MLRQFFPLFVCLLVISSAKAQIESDKPNGFKLNTSGLPFGFYEIKFEFAFNSQSSILIAGGAASVKKKQSAADRKFRNELDTDFFDGRDNLYFLEIFKTATAEYRYFFHQKGFLEGLYASSGIQFFDLRERYYSNDNEIVGGELYILFNFNAKIGYQYNLGQTFQINPFVGFSQSIKSADSYEVNDVKIDRYGAGFNLLYGLDLGIRF